LSSVVSFVFGDLAITSVFPFASVRGDSHLSDTWAAETSFHVKLVLLVKATVRVDKRTERTRILNARVYKPHGYQGRLGASFTVYIGHHSSSCGCRSTGRCKHSKPFPVDSRITPCSGTIVRTIAGVQTKQ
jgi:hypothetical protein